MRDPRDLRCEEALEKKDAGALPCCLRMLGGRCRSEPLGASQEVTGTKSSLSPSRGEQYARLGAVLCHIHAYVL